MKCAPFSQEILEEVRKELQKVKEEIIGGNRVCRGSKTSWPRHDTASHNESRFVSSLSCSFYSGAAEEGNIVVLDDHQEERRVGTEEVMALCGPLFRRSFNFSPGISLSVLYTHSLHPSLAAPFSVSVALSLTHTHSLNNNPTCSYQAS